MQKIEIFGKDQSKKFNVLIALVAGLIPIFNHMLYPNSNIDIVPMVNNAFPQISLILIAIVSLLLILGLFGMKVGTGGATGWFANVIIFGSIVAVVLIFGSSAGFNFWQLPYWLRSWLNGETVSIVIAILVFALVIGYITGDDKEQKEKEARRKEISENPGKFFGLK